MGLTGEKKGKKLSVDAIKVEISRTGGIFLDDDELPLGHRGNGTLCRNEVGTPEV